nr:integrase, catalytic region, zinc finger, CCHC-type, peptidase aspartic, catalytic [Tanacetum cinerariifolium]
VEKFLETVRFGNNDFTVIAGYGDVVIGSITIQKVYYVEGWIDKEIPISEGSPITRSERFQETYKNVSQEIRDQLNAEAEAVQIILTGIDNDIYSTVDACPNVCEMWKAIKRLK